MPAVVSQMLVDALANSLMRPKDLRHEMQERTVGMIRSALEQGEAALVSKLAAVQEEVAQAGVAVEQAAAVVEGKHNEQQAKEERLQGLKKGLASDALVFKAAKEALQGLQQSAKRADKELAAATAKHENLKTFLAEKVGLLEAGVEQEDARKQLAEELIAFAQEHEFEESFLTAAPIAFAQAPTDRTPFDAALVAQFRQEVAKRETAAAEAVKAIETSKAAKQGELAGATTAFEAAKAAQLKSAEAFMVVQKEVAEAEAAVSAAQVAERAAKTQSQRAKRDGSTIEKKLEAFRGAIEAFNELAERTTPVLKAAEPLEAEMAGAEAKSEVEIAAAGA